MRLPYSARFQRVYDALTDRDADLIILRNVGPHDAALRKP